MTQVYRKGRIGMPDILTRRPAASVLDGIGNTPLVNVEGVCGTAVAEDRNQIVEDVREKYLSEHFRSPEDSAPNGGQT